MSDINKQEVGAITWADLTVPNTAAVKDFYRQVVGWKFEPVAMGEYNDFKRWRRCSSRHRDESMESPLNELCLNAKFGRRKLWVVIFLL